MTGRPGRAGGRRSRGQRGSAPVEFLGALPLVLLGALAAWQLLLAGATAVSAENAARNGSRAAGLGAGPAEVRQAVEDGLSDWLVDEGVQVGLAGTRVSVTVPVPLVLPGLSRQDVAIHRDAELPATGVGGGVP